MLVLDEADELLQNDTFRIQVQNIRDGLTHHRLQTLCLSATYPNSLKDFVLKVAVTQKTNNFWSPKFRTFCDHSEKFVRSDPLIIKSQNVQLDGIGQSSKTNHFEQENVAPYCYNTFFLKIKIWILDLVSVFVAG